MQPELLHQRRAGFYVLDHVIRDFGLKPITLKFVADDPGWAILIGEELRVFPRDGYLKRIATIFGVDRVKYVEPACEALLDIEVSIPYLGDLVRHNHMRQFLALVDERPELGRRQRLRINPFKIPAGELIAMRTLPQQDYLPVRPAGGKPSVVGTFGGR